MGQGGMELSASDLPLRTTAGGEQVTSVLAFVFNRDCTVPSLARSRFVHSQGPSGHARAQQRALSEELAAARERARDGEASLQQKLKEAREALQRPTAEHASLGVNDADMQKELEMGKATLGDAKLAALQQEFAEQQQQIAELRCDTVEELTE